MDRTPGQQEIDAGGIEVTQTNQENEPPEHNGESARQNEGPSLEMEYKDTRVQFLMTLNELVTAKSSESPDKEQTIKEKYKMAKVLYKKIRNLTKILKHRAITPQEIQAWYDGKNELEKDWATTTMGLQLLQPSICGTASSRASTQSQTSFSSSKVSERRMEKEEEQAALRAKAQGDEQVRRMEEQRDKQTAQLEQKIQQQEEQAEQQRQELHQQQQDLMQLQQLKEREQARKKRNCKTERSFAAVKHKGTSTGGSSKQS